MPKIDSKNNIKLIESDMADKLTDLIDYYEALHNLKLSNNKTVSRENVLKELGLNQNNKCKSI